MVLKEELYRQILGAKIPGVILSILKKMLRARHSYIMNYLLQTLRLRVESLQVRSESLDVSIYSPVILDLLDEIWIILESSGFGISEVIKQREYNLNNRTKRNLVLLDLEVRNKIITLILSRLSGHITPKSLNVRPVYSAGVENRTIYVNGNAVLTLLDKTHRKELLQILRKNVAMFPKWCDDY